MTEGKEEGLCGMEESVVTKKNEDQEKTAEKKTRTTQVPIVERIWKGDTRGAEDDLIRSIKRHKKSELQKGVKYV